METADSCRLSAGQQQEMVRRSPSSFRDCLSWKRRAPCRCQQPFRWRNRDSRRLGRLAGRRLMAPGCDHPSRPALQTHPVREDRVASLVASLSQFPQQHAPVPDAGREAFPKVRLERVKFARSCRSRPIDTYAGGSPQVLSQGLPAPPRHPADGPHPQALPLQPHFLLHVLSLCQMRAPPRVRDAEPSFRGWGFLNRNYGDSYTGRDRFFNRDLGDS